MSEFLIEIKDLKKYFPIRKGIFSAGKSFVKAIDGVSFGIKKGETLGLVGESGCGKTTVGRCIVKLIQPTEGEILLNGENIISLKGNKLKEYRKKVQIIFQDPYSTLNPRITIGSAIKEIIKFHKIAEGSGAEKKVNELLEMVGLRKSFSKRYPHEFSGGQRQRISIARALSVEPELIICDEPVSALDVSIQAQIINLLKDLQKDLQLSYLFISHNLSVVEHISDRVCIMYLGKIIEESDYERIYNNPKHPYTQALISAIPNPEPGMKSKRILLKGDIPSPSDIPGGCAFHPRCQYVMDKCKIEVPLLEGDGVHSVSCFLNCQGSP